MSNYHSYPAMFSKKESKPYRLTVSDAGESVALERMSKHLVIRNVGANKVFIAFEEDAVVDEGFELNPSGTTFIDELDIDFQTEQIFAICDTGEAAELMVMAIQ